MTKVIAIKDSPVVNSAQFGKAARAYKVGDIFELRIEFEDQLVIYHPLTVTMAVTKENFKKLQEHRNTRIDEIIR